MTTALSLLCRVVRRRLTNGDAIDIILANYPKLTEKERKILLEALGK